MKIKAVFGVLLALSNAHDWAFMPDEDEGVSLLQLQMRPSIDPKHADHGLPEPFLQSTLLSRSDFDLNEEISDESRGLVDDLEITDGVVDGHRTKTVNMLTAKATPDSPPLLHIIAHVEQLGDGEDDFWIRRIQVTGGYFSGMKYRFRTGNGAYADADSYNLARVGDVNWTQPEDVLKYSQGQMYLTGFDKPEPTENFVSSPHKEVELVAGPMDIKVRYATSNKDGVEYNHLNLLVSGFLKLTAQKVSYTGVLAEDAAKVNFNDRKAEGPQEQPEESLNLVQGVREVRLFR